MKTFKIISTAWGLAIFSMLMLLISEAIILHEILPNKSNFYIVSFIPLILLGIYLQKFISVAKIEVALTKDYLTLRWLKQYIFHKEPDRKIFFTEIKSYKYQEDRNLDLFQITLLDGTEINFWHFTFTKDDFEKLAVAFPEYVHRHNKAVESKESNKNLETKVQKIERAKTIYENSTSPALVVFAILLIIAISLLMIFNRDKISNPFMGLAVMSGAIFYLRQYFKYRKRKNSN